VLTPEQREAGLIGWLARGSLADLMNAFDEQAVLRCRRGSGAVVRIAWRGMRSAAPYPVGRVRA